jgi:hypothetical protein
MSSGHSLDAVEQKKISDAPTGSQTPAPEPGARRFIDRASPAQPFPHMI